MLKRNTNTYISTHFVANNATINSKSFLEMSIVIVTIIHTYMHTYTHLYTYTDLHTPTHTHIHTCTVAYNKEMSVMIYNQTVMSMKNY